MRDRQRWAGSPAGLPAGVRLSDHISLGVIARTFPREQVRQVLAETGEASERERERRRRHGLLRVRRVARVSGTDVLAYPRSGSSDADVLWASEFQHSVQHLGGDRHFGHLPPVGLEA